MRQDKGYIQVTRQPWETPIASRKRTRSTAGSTAVAGYVEEADRWLVDVPEGVL
jgi:hypothetical protein